MPLNLAQQGYTSVDKSEYDRRVEAELAHSGSLSSNDKSKLSMNPPPSATGHWPPELKPRLSDIMHDGAVLKHIADEAGEPVFAFGDDLSNYFHQLRMAPSEYWSMCTLMGPLREDHKPGGPAFVSKLT